MPPACNTFLMRTTIAVLLLLAIPSLAQDASPDASSQVTISLDAYETLRRNSDAPSRTVIDTILLGGGFRERNLSITFSGRTLGTRPAAPATRSPTS